MLKALLRHALDRTGYALVKKAHYPALWDMKGPAEREFEELSSRCEGQTMTSPERRYALYLAVRYIAEHKIPGALVECGVWRGGSSMLMALTLLKHEPPNRPIRLFDTFAGMSEPTDKDTDFAGKSAAYALSELGGKKFGEMNFAPLETVQKNLLSTGYPADLIRFEQGKVEDTLPARAPAQIALLRLDTDWYESTYHELVHLYPRLIPGGVLIIDDYGHWRGAKEATDRYFAETKSPVLLNRIDSTGRISVKIR